ncbi:MAG: histidine kinase [Clostridia bacterium]|nr:histidine kinase [Clostridia bacterium]
MKYGLKRMMVLLALLAILVAFTASAYAEESRYIPPTQDYVEKLTLLPVLSLLIVLIIIVWIDPYLRRRDKRIMKIIILVMVSLVIQNVMEERLAVGSPRPLLRSVFAVYGYVIRPVLLVLLMHLVKPGKRFRWAWWLVGINAAIYCTAFFSGIAFTITPDNYYLSGPLGDMGVYVSSLLMAGLAGITVRSFDIRRVDTWVPLVTFPLIILGVILDFTVHSEPQPVTFLTMTVVISAVLYYIWLHLQFVREHEQVLRDGQRTQLMLSQIKPHFLHNALTVIVGLCDIDPQRAKQATLKFARYLRGNMDTLEESGPIPFEKELAHTKIYLEIEQLRFGDALQVHYEITSTDFQIPALTLEPLVENAVRHGVRENPDGKGSVSIAALETLHHYEIIVVDDGPGFDPNIVPMDGRKHIGIANVRERLRQVCGGTLEFDSAPGRGTTACIMIPKE